MKEEKVQKFLNDEVMSEAVYDVLLKAFIKARPQSDVNTLAASRIAIDLLHEAWKDLQKYRQQTERDKPILVQVGL